MLIGKKKFLFKILLCLAFIIVMVWWLPQPNAMSENHHSFFGSNAIKKHKYEDIQEIRKEKLKGPWNEYFEAQFREMEKKMVPGLGDNGVPVTLVGEEAAKVPEVLKKEAFNLILSDKLMFNRTVPDARDPGCRKIKYDSELPSASVIIIFNNERWSSLLRTVHSVLIGSPAKYLHEIVLIDDKSDHEELQEKLDYYIQTRFPKDKVKLFRMEKRSGLVKARLEGARRATGDVIVFLDAHCEVGPKWLEPLLQRIKDERKAVVVPIIDVIDDKTFEYMHNQGSYSFQVGGFTWSGHFTWIDISKEEIERRKVSTAPTRSPTMAGGLFAMDRKYFWEIGSYDGEMDVWGGENLEMSFRVWQCGGLLETIPCSRVGHIFRDFHPYTFPGHKDTHGINTARLVNVWMGPYGRFFYMNRPDLKKIDIGDITERMKLKERLQCKDFGWYLKNVYKDKFIPDENVQAYGRVGTKVNNICLDMLQKSEDNDHELGVYSCHANLFPSQYFSLSNKGELRREFMCCEIKEDKKIWMTKCTEGENQKWTIEKDGSLKHTSSGMCLDSKGLSTQASVYVAPCNGSPTQVWQWEYIRSELLSKT